MSLQEAENGMDASTALSTQLARARKKKGFTVRQLAKLIQKRDGAFISPSYVTDLEKSRGIFSDYIALQFSALLDLDKKLILELASKARKERRSDDD